MIDKEFLPNSSAIGAEGVERFKFLALKQGQVEVTMLYRREWDNETIKKQIVIVQILPATPKTLTVKQVGENMKQLDGQVVRIKGKFCGWDVGDNVMGTRITRSDWGIRDDTGTIWVTDGTGGLDPSYPSKDIGKSIILTASVLKQSGTSAYFLKAIDVRVES